MKQGANSIPSLGLGIGLSRETREEAVLISVTLDRRGGPPENGGKWPDSGSVLKTVLPGCSVACAKVRERDDILDPSDRVAVGTDPESQSA